MEEQGSGQTMAALAAATAIQTEVAHQRLALMWSQMVFDHLLKVWNHIEDHETLAYEDKVGVQVGLLQQASTNLGSARHEKARAKRCHSTVDPKRFPRQRRSTASDGHQR